MIIAHRGFSGQYPEMTISAYRAAIDWSRDTNTPLGLECDVQLSADDELVCLHDVTVDRTSDRSGRVGELTLAELRSLDFGSWKVPKPSLEQRSMVTLRDLLEMVRDARRGGVDVSACIETKHPSRRSREIEARVAALLTEFGWHQPGSPAYPMSFSLAAVKRFGALLPALPRTLLLERDLGRWRSGRLPDGVRRVGVDVDVVKQDPDFVNRARKRGNEVHVWTTNDPDDIAFCHSLGIVNITTDYPDRVLHTLAQPAYSG